jgi:hypothetical protein
MNPKFSNYTSFYSNDDNIFLILIMTIRVVIIISKEKC